MEFAVCADEAVGVPEEVLGVLFEWMRRELLNQDSDRCCQALGAEDIGSPITIRPEEGRQAMTFP